MARVEPEGDPILPVHAETVAAPLVALEGFQAMDHQLVESSRGVEIVQSPTDDRPEVVADGFVRTRQAYQKTSSNSRLKGFTR